MTPKIDQNLKRGYIQMIKAVHVGSVAKLAAWKDSQRKGRQNLDPIDELAYASNGDLWCIGP